MKQVCLGEVSETEKETERERSCGWDKIKTVRVVWARGVRLAPIGRTSCVFIRPSTETNRLGQLSHSAFRKYCNAECLRCRLVSSYWPEYEYLQALIKFIYFIQMYIEVHTRVPFKKNKNFFLYTLFEY